MRIVIFDILLGTVVFHSTPRPSMEALLISGYHKSQGHQVLLTDEPPNFSLYDKVYLIKDAPELFHDPDWLTYDNAVPVGRYWGGVDVVWNENWEKVLPDSTLYTNWVNTWMKRYPSFSKNRLEPFFRKPVKIKQGNKIVIPEGQELLIIDNDMHEWDKDCEILQEVPMRNGLLLYPMVLDGRWNSVLKTFQMRHLKRQNFWSDMNFNDYNREDLIVAQETFNRYKPSRLFRIKCHIEGRNNEDWLEIIPEVYNMLGDFRMNCGKRIFIQPHYIYTFDFPRILTELKRWTAKDMGYTKNSLFDYIIYDGCRDVEKMAEFLADPYAYTAAKKHGKNKFVELIPFIETYPGLMDTITKSYDKAGW